MTWSDLVSDSLFWQESRPGLSDGDQNQKNHRETAPMAAVKSAGVCRPGHIPHEGEQASVAACGPSTSPMPAELQRERSEGGQVCFAATEGRRGSPTSGLFNSSQI